ncbi:MAG: BatD family protein, partial [Pusillimonas sp.]
MHRILVLILALLAVISPIYAASFSVETTVDKDKVEFGESLQFVVTLTQEYGSGRMQNLSIPQISNIPGFDIASTRSGQSTTIVNGVGHIKSQMVYELVPQKAGEFTIPAINFKNQNGEEASSKPIKITIMPPPANNSSKNEANNSSDEPNFEQNEPKAATSIFKALLMLGFILLLFIAIPFIYLSQKAKKIAKNTKWEEDAVVVEAKNSEVDSAPIKVIKPIRKAAKVSETPKTAYTTKKSSDYNLGDYKKMNLDNPELQKRIELAGETVEKIRKEVKKVLVGQDELLDFLILALVSDGHILLEGVPGLAKTLAIKALARTVKTNFSRIQFTPDLLPADLIGTRIF